MHSRKGTHKDIDVNSVNEVHISVRYLYVSQLMLWILKRSPAWAYTIRTLTFDGCMANAIRNSEITGDFNLVTTISAASILV